MVKSLKLIDTNPMVGMVALLKLKKTLTEENKKK